MTKMKSEKLTNEERKALYVELCNQAHSNIEAPIMGTISKPRCAKCIHFDVDSDLHSPLCPLCATVNESYDMYDNDDKYCPHFKQKKEFNN